VKKLKTIWTERKRIADERLAICQTCEFLDKRLGLCEKCGCFMEFKTMFSWAECPIGKWKSDDESERGDHQHPDKGRDGS
jgi:Family of unknown function (DUF6171)